MDLILVGVAAFWRMNAWFVGIKVHSTYMLSLYPRNIPAVRTYDALINN